MNFFKLLALVVIISFSGCATMHSYSLSDPAAADTKGTEISVEETTSTYFHLNNPVFAGNIQEDLLKQCPRGRVVGTRTWLNMREWLGWVQNYTLTANALCVAAK
ncbi:MAG: hypothetical protein ACXWQO_04360 [Bdellovibrionota bacterium]